MTETQTKEQPKVFVEPEVMEEIALQNIDPVARERTLVEASAERAKMLRRVSIAQTEPEDWVLNEDRQGKVFGYLQDSGCQRVLSLWGIRFDKVELGDFQKERLEDGHIRYEVMVTGRSDRAGIERTEIGSRSTTGLFGPAWAKAIQEGDAALRAEVLANVKKSALTNGNGRLVRAITGLGRVPERELQEVFGERMTGIGKVERQRGTRGGSTTRSDAPSEPQVKKLAAMCCMDEMVEGCTREDFGNVKSGIEKLVRENKLTKKAFSGVIEWLSERDGAVSKDLLFEKLGWKPGPGKDEKPAEGGDA